MQVDEEATLDEFRTWLARNRRSDWRDYDRHVPLDVRATASRAWEATLGEAGWLGLTWPVAHGGRGLSLALAAQIQHELAAAGAPQLMNEVGLDLVGPAVIAFGTDEQKRRVLPGLLAGEIWCQGFSEPDAGSDLASLRTRAVHTDSRWVIDGQKIWSTFGSQAAHCLLLARTEPDAPKHRGISCFLVPLDTPGVEVRPIRDATGDEDFAELFFTGCEVPNSALLGERGDGWRIAMEVLGNERGAMFGLLVAVQRDMAGVVDVLRSHDDEGLRSRAVDCYVREEVSQWASVIASRAFSDGRPDHRLESTLKLGWSELHQEVTELAVDALGLIGLLEREDEQSVDRGRWPFALLHSRSETIYGGTSEIQRNIIANRVLGLPKV